MRSCTTCTEMVFPGTENSWVIAWHFDYNPIRYQTIILQLSKAPGVVPKCYCSLMPRPHTSLMRKRVVWWLLSTYIYAWFVLSQQSSFRAKQCNVMQALNATQWNRPEQQKLCLNLTCNILVDTYPIMDYAWRMCGPGCCNSLPQIQKPTCRIISN